MADALPSDPQAFLGDTLPGYAPLAGVPDELMDADGAIRPAWRPFIDQFRRLTPAETRRAFARADQYLDDAGVFFRQYGDGDSRERAWPLSHVPVIVDEAEWQAIADGLVQRAALLERVAADLYGRNRLVTDGHLPAELIAGSREWLRPLVGVRPAPGRYLHFLAFEIGRGPSGRWWVLGDRAQAPSGIGFTLENRLAVQRVWPAMFATGRIHRVAGFFRHFRDMLRDLRLERDSEVGILTPGPLVDTYFEHAYIARYLGMLLLQGEDLVVRRGRLLVRTIEGLKPLSVLWRRIDSAYVDPLELEERSRLATPAMLAALRSGALTLANMPGTGILETHALMAFLPRLAQLLLGEDLLLPNIATWWCGSPAERQHVKANLGRMLLSDAFATNLPFEPAAAAVPEGPAGDWIDANATRLIGREVATLSTTPMWIDGRLQPRPMSLRVFVARGHDGWHVMPGGFARIARADDPRAVGMQHGGSAADVWIVAPQPVRQPTMLTGIDATIGEERMSLPARAAENLFWLGRYIERSENILRLARACHARSGSSGIDAPINAFIADYLQWKGIETAAGVPGALLRNLAAAMTSGGAVRDRFAPDGWAALKDLEKSAARMARTVSPGDDAAHAARILLRKIAGLSGLTHENMYRFDGWRFLTIGRALERASNLADLLARTMTDDAPAGALDFAVEVADSTLSHRRRYPMLTTVASVGSILLTDARNPRAVLFQSAIMADEIGQLPRPRTSRANSPLMRSVLKVRLELETADPATVDGALAARVGDLLATVSDLLSQSYFH